MPRRPVLSLVAALTALLVGAGPAAAAPSTAGAPGLGDPYFPYAGNGGYDVGHYDLRLAWDKPHRGLSGTATITATATQDLSRFDLDLRPGLTVTSLTVAGKPARWRFSGQQEMVVTPDRLLRKGTGFTVVVRYHGRPAYVTDPDGSPDGWIDTDDGVFVANEPQGSPSWYPVNDHPLDKATYRIGMTVPAGLTAVGNGRLVKQVTKDGRTTFVWDEAHPMAPYLATITIGKFDVTTSKAAGVPSYVAVDPRLAAKAAPVLAKLPQILAWEQSVFGPYPFDTVGAIVDKAPQVGYALETQTKPVFDSVPDVSTLVHELAHQWYGDSVSITTWKDIWLNEGFATYAEWLWSEHTGGPTAKQIFDETYATPADDELWSPPPGDPGSGAQIFSTAVYERGALTLGALRQRIGDTAFFAVLRKWAAQHRDGHGTTAQFVALAEKVSGQDLGAFFQTWLYDDGKPAAS